jgi:hypothetical protein
MNSDGTIFADGAPGPASRLLAEHERLRRDGFARLERFSPEELDWLQRIHDKRLDFYREERRMHFGAFALVGLAFVVLLGPTLTLADGPFFLPLAGAEALLLHLLVPYTFVYRRYEEGVRRMMRESVALEDARRARGENSCHSAADPVEFEPVDRGEPRH